MQPIKLKNIMGSFNYIILMILVLSSCHPDNNDGKGLLFINNSSSDVYFYNSEDFSVGHFPDTILPIEKPIGLQPIIANGKSGKYVDPNWTEIYSQLPDDKFTVYVFSKEIVDNTLWQEIRDNYLILQRFDITFEELKSSDYTITYNE